MQTHDEKCFKSAKMKIIYRIYSITVFNNTGILCDLRQIILLKVYLLVLVGCNYFKHNGI